MKKAKKTAVRKTLTNKISDTKKSKTRSQPKAKIQVKTKAKAQVKTPVKRKAARKPGTDLQKNRPMENQLAAEKSRGVIPDSAKRDSWTDLTREALPKKTISRKVAGKKPVFPLGHSEK